MPFRIQASGLTVAIRLTPNARKSGFNGLAKMADDKIALKISLNSVPEDGKANKDLLAFLSKEWKLPKASLSLLSGHTNRQKVVLIEGDGQKLLDRLSTYVTSAEDC